MLFTSILFAIGDMCVTVLKKTQSFCFGLHIKCRLMKIKLTRNNSTEVTEQPRIYCMILVKLPHYTSISTVKYVSSLRSHVTRDVLISKDTPETEDLVKES